MSAFLNGFRLISLTAKHNGVEAMKWGTSIAVGLVASFGGALQAQEARITQTLPSPSPVSVPPPIATTIESSGQDATRNRVIALDVRVFGGNEEIWSRPLTLRGYGGAQITLDIAEASSCSREGEGGYSSQRTGLRLQLSQRGAGDRFQVNTSWTRRSSDCAKPGTLTVGVDVGVELPPGGTRTVNGDGGLRVVLSRPR